MYKKLIKSPVRLVSILTGVLLSCAIAKSAEFVAPEWSDVSGASFSQWLTFTQGFGEPGNTPDVEGSNTHAILIQKTPGGIATGSGNIYNPAGASVFEVNTESDSPYQTVIFQAMAIGELDTGNVQLEYDNNDEIVSLPAEPTELARESGGFGDTILTQWTWDLSDLSVSNIRIRFSAQVPHLSLVSARLDTLVQVVDDTREIVLEAPAHDLWNYPFNATPGRRTSASVFREIRENDGAYRYGNFVFAYDTGDLVETGLDPEAYEIISARVQLMTTGNFETPYDPTFDRAATHLPEEHSEFTPDTDPGRPVELFGTGFRNGIDLLAWTESTPYSPGQESDVTAFPALLNDQDELVDATLAADFSQPMDSIPLAVGTLTSIEPGEWIPEDTWMDFEIDLSRPTTVAYLQRGIASGRLAFTLTSLNGGGQGVRTFPEFHTSDSLVGEAPRLDMLVRIQSPHSLPLISNIATSSSGIHLRFESLNQGNINIRWTSDFLEWHQVENPILQETESGLMEWIDTDPEAGTKFYQLIFLP